MWAVLGRPWGLCQRSWAALGISVGGLGPLFVLLWAVLAALEIYVGGLGPLLWSLLAVLGRLGPKNNLGPSRRKAIWQADLGQQVTQTRTRRAFRGGGGNGARAGPWAPKRIVSIDYVFFLPNKSTPQSYKTLVVVPVEPENCISSHPFKNLAQNLIKNLAKCWSKM